MRGREYDGCGEPPTSDNEPETHSRSAGYSCPNCSRATLEATPDELTDFRCGVCNHRVREQVGE